MVDHADEFDGHAARPLRGSRDHTPFARKTAEGRRGYFAPAKVP